MTEEDDRSVLSRAGRIIAAFGPSDRVLSLNELSLRSGLPKSTAHRFAGHLLSLEWLERDLNGYRIGLRLFELGRLAKRRNMLRESATPYLQDLAVQTRLTANLALLDRGEVLCVGQVRAEAYSVPFGDGSRLPATCTALGKALLAEHVHHGAIPEGLVSSLPRKTDLSITDVGGLARELDRVKKSGVAFDRGELSPGLSCVAAAIEGDSGTAAAISVTAPTIRFDADRMAKSVSDMATTVAEALRESAFFADLGL